MKQVEKDAESKLEPPYVQSAKNDSQMADLFISSSKWSTQNYREAFWYDGEILESGLPRMDIMFTDPTTHYKNICKFYQVNESVHFALYAPTFRADHSTTCYNMDYRALKAGLEKRFGGEWKILVRLHPNVQKLQGFMKYDEDILNGSKYEEINELILASDLLITDYSSCMFDAMFAKKKVMLYASDIEAYNDDRGTYFTFDELPFPLAENNEELLKNVESYEEEYWAKRRAEFEERIGFFEDGHATERVVERIMQVINE